MDLSAEPTKGINNINPSYSMTRDFEMNEQCHRRLIMCSWIPTMMPKMLKLITMKSLESISMLSFFTMRIKLKKSFVNNV